MGAAPRETQQSDAKLLLQSCILFELCVRIKKKKEEEEERRRTNSKFLHSIFSTVRRSNGTLGLYFT